MAWPQWNSVRFTLRTPDEESHWKPEMLYEPEVVSPPATVRVNQAGCVPWWATFAMQHDILLSGIILLQVSKTAHVVAIIFGILLNTVSEEGAVLAQWKCNLDHRRFDKLPPQAVSVHWHRLSRADRFPKPRVVKAIVKQTLREASHFIHTWKIFQAPKVVKTAPEVGTITCLDVCITWIRSNVLAELMYGYALRDVDHGITGSTDIPYMNHLQFLKDSTM